MGGCAAAVSHKLARMVARRGSWALLPTLLVAASCGQTPASDGPDAAPPRCRAPAGVSARPSSIAEAVALVNALPRPLDVTCYLESLARPLAIEATSSVISLQPAVGTRSPRIFVVEAKLFSSFAPAGKGAPMLELGELVDEVRSLKAEIAFPLEGPLDGAEPYARVRSTTGGTVCAGCHRDEQRDESTPFAEAFVSGALRPAPRTRVTLERVRAEHAACDPAVEPERCAFFRALFEHGDVVQGAFPASLPTIFD